MSKKRVAVEFGIGTSLRKMDYTQAAIRGMRDALWRNSLSMAEAFGFEKSEMLIDVQIGVQKPELVDIDALKNIIPYGQATFLISKGGLDILKPDGHGTTAIANATIVVSFNMERSV
ncbi:MAG: Lin0512 family protein [Proteobacteria bacterium]|jgi:uncharacterized protein (TIGR02058 family)|nr:Lin0512 family protein [Pseudomonadota bacterium]